MANAARLQPEWSSRRSFLNASSHPRASLVQPVLEIVLDEHLGVEHLKSRNYAKK